MAVQIAKHRFITGFNMRKHPTTSGFTIIELMIATLVFSIILLVIIGAFLQIGHIFFKGVSLANTQESSRSLIGDITDDLRFARNPQCIDDKESTDSQSVANTPQCTVDANTRFFCVGTHRYVYTLAKNMPAGSQKMTNDDISQNSYTNYKGVVETTIPAGCPHPGTTSEKNRKQLLGPDMQLNALSMKCAANFCTIHTHIIFYGADDGVFESASAPSDALRAPDAQCTGDLRSTQFCAVSDMTTSVNMRF
jgi:prepilin-type N-terminal cleavage/methylation domain-containing protein